MQSSIDILVPGAHPLVGDWYDLTPAAADGMPPHITLLWPWVPAPTPEAVARLRDAAAEVAPFGLLLAATARFPGVLYVELAPAAPVLALSRAIWSAFPETPPYAGTLDHEPLPHLTAAKGDDLDHAEQVLRQRLVDPLEVWVDKVSVSQQGAGPDGRWAVVAEVNLAG